MDTRTSAPTDATPSINLRGEPPSLSRRARFGSALAGVLMAAVLLGSVVLGLTRMAGPPAASALAAASAATGG